MRSENGPKKISKIMVEDSFYHVCSDGTSQKWLFKDDKDYIAGVNRIGICAFTTSVKVYKYVLMDNHVHFLLKGTQPSCKAFINKYKLLTGKWILHKYGECAFVSGLGVQIIRITSQEYLFEVMAYIDRNVIKANFPYLPSEYRWGSAKYLFKKRSSVVGTTLSELSVRGQRAALGTHTMLPQGWEIFPDGMLNPLCFCEFDSVESLFKTPARYLYFLSKKVEGRVEEDMTSLNRTYIMDKDLRHVVESLAKEMYGASDIRKLDMGARLGLAKKLRYEYFSTPKQISRMLGVSVDALKGYI